MGNGVLKKKSFIVRFIIGVLFSFFIVGTEKIAFLVETGSETYINQFFFSTMHNLKSIPLMLLKEYFVVIATI